MYSLHHGKPRLPSNLAACSRNILSVPLESSAEAAQGQCVTFIRHAADIGARSALYETPASKERQTLLGTGFDIRSDDCKLDPCELVRFRCRRSSQNVQYLLAQVFTTLVAFVPNNLPLNRAASSSVSNFFVKMNGTLADLLMGPALQVGTNEI